MSSARTFLLIPGAGGSAWYWHRVVAALEARGHEAIAVALPAEDESAGWAEYVEAAAQVAVARDRNFSFMGSPRVRTGHEHARRAGGL